MVLKLKSDQGHIVTCSVGDLTAQMNLFINHSALYNLLNICSFPHLSPVTVPHNPSYNAYYSDIVLACLYDFYAVGGEWVRDIFIHF